MSSNPANAPHTITRKRGAKTIRVRVAPDGQVLVTAPFFVSRRRIEAFIADHASWITARQAMHRTDNTLLSNQLVQGIGIIHSQSSTIRARTQKGNLLLEHPEDVNLAELYAAARPRIIRLLKKQAEQQLEPQFAVLANRLGYDYTSLRWRYMKGRWGSCTNDNIITLNTQLLRLSEEQYSYVMIHELAHTNHHHHQASFWDAVRRMDTNYQVHRKQLRKIQLWR